MEKKEEEGDSFDEAGRGQGKANRMAKKLRRDEEVKSWQ